MPTSPVVTVTNSGLTLSAYPGDGAVLLGYSLEQSIVKNNDLAGFAIQCTPPSGQSYFLLNRLSFTQPVTSGTTPQKRPFTSSNDAPFQKFHWVHFPPDVTPGAGGSHVYKYKVIARFCQGTGLVDGPSAEVTVDLNPQSFTNFEFGFTRGYISSQAYASKFHNADIRPTPKTLDYDTKPFQPQYSWLGFHAHKMIFDLLDECLHDPSVTVDLFAYDIDEADIVRKLQALGPRLRAFLDNASLHTGTALEVQVHTRLQQSAGAANVKQGHFKRFAHDKIIIAKKNGKPFKVLTGSANFSVRGLYVQSNNVLMFNDPQIAGLYEQVFESVFQNMSAFSGSQLAAKTFPFPSQPGIPNFSVSFAPHKQASVSLADVQNALNGAKSSVLFAVMALEGSGNVLSTLQSLHASGKVFSYGMTQNVAGFTVYKVGEPGQLIPFSALIKNVPPPFDKEVTGGQGQVIHDKFIVVDFNGANPVVFTGSSNLAEGGETSNGDNLLMINDPVVAQAFAVEAIRMVDHYQFRAAMKTATNVRPLVLSPCGGTPKWWEHDYDPNDIHNLQRELFSGGPGAITSVPSSGISPPTGPSKPAKKKPSKPPAKKKPGPKKKTKSKPAKKTRPKKKAPARKKTKKRH
jgi:phospholipase D-like protein